MNGVSGGFGESTGTLALSDVVADDAGRKSLLGAFVVVQRDAELMQLVDAVGAPGGLAGRLNGRQQERDQDADDGDHDQQFDEREAAAASQLCELVMRSPICFSCADEQRAMLTSANVVGSGTAPPSLRRHCRAMVVRKFLPRCRSRRSSTSLSPLASPVGCVPVPVVPLNLLQTTKSAASMTPSLLKSASLVELGNNRELEEVGKIIHLPLPSSRAGRFSIESPVKPPPAVTIWKGHLRAGMKPLIRVTLSVAPAPVNRW